jgi:hypothetical protein
MHTYKILRFYRNRRPELIQTGLTLEQAQEHCSDESTHKKDKEGNVVWFDGYESE